MKKYKNKTWLFDKYIKKNMTSIEISRLCGTPSRTIRHWIRKFNFVRRIRYKNEKWLKSLYINEGYSSTDIAGMCGCTYSVILRWLKRLGIKTRTLSESLNIERANKKIRESMSGDKNPMRGKFGENNPNWTGGVVRRNKGYVAFYMPWHPNNHQGYVFEHVLKASQALKRPLNKNERVHHVNGIKDDNRNCNLLISDQSYHAWLHARMSQLYMKDHFATGA